MDASQPAIASDSPGASPQGVAPIAPAERIAALDTLRGFAIFGILLVNMPLFNAPVQVLMMSTPWWTSPVDRVAEVAVRTVAEGKFYALFSLLFGLGMAIQMERIEARGGRFLRVYVRRLLVLLGIGLCHGLLFWYGDILTIYALMGSVLVLFRKRVNKTILIWALVLYCLPWLLAGGCTALVEVARLHPEAAAEIDQAFAEVEAGALADAGRSIEVYGSGTLTEIFRQRLENHAHILWGTLFMLPVILTMFLLGLYVGRRGMLRDLSPYRQSLRRLAVGGLPLGLLCNLGFALSLEWGSRLRPDWVGLAGYTLYVVGMPLLSFGYAAVIILLVQNDRWKRRLAPLAAVGRMALTNYLVQTLLCTTLFYSYGLALYGKVGPALGLVLAGAIYLVQIPLSVWWLRNFRFGPMEWLWRSLTYARWQPMRLSPATPPSSQPAPGQRDPQQWR